MKNLKNTTAKTTIAHSGVGGRRAIAWRPGWAPRLASGLLALCMLWSFGVAPVAVAATARGPQKPRPYSAWMPPEKAARMKGQAAHLLAMQRRAQRTGFPYRQANAARALKPLPRLRAASPLTRLDEVGQLISPVPDALAAAWSRELTTAKPAADRAARLHLWLGEWQLACNEQPETAFKHFQAAQRLSRPEDSLYGLAAYDRAISFYDEGAYEDAVTAFRHLLSLAPRLHGFSRPAAALWLRHAGACAGYHADRERAGIPEPPRLDPLCGAAALASSLRALGLPFGRKTILASVRVTGEGSNAQDLVAGIRKLGLSARTVQADDRGLILLPKPLVAFVEHDHWVSLVRADRKGVSYLCSDCGAWPGGRVDLSWAQWHLLEGGLYVSVGRPGGSSDRLLAGLGARPGVPPGSISLDFPPKGAPIRVAFTGRLTDLGLSLRPFVPAAPSARVDAVMEGRLAALRGHVVLQAQPISGSCGVKNSSLHCVNATNCCLTAAGGPGGAPVGAAQATSNRSPLMAKGPTSGDPVNLATGEEEYSPSPDLEVYNPHGPGVTWARYYNSMRNAGQGFFEPGDNLAGDFYYQMNDFGAGWSRSYNVGVSDTSPGTVGSGSPKYVFFENGARIQFTVPSSPSATTPQVLCQPTQGGQPLAGVPFLIYADYAAAGNYYKIVFSDRVQWVTTAAASIASPLGGTYAVYPLTQIADRTGHAITFHYGPAAGGNSDGDTFAWPLLSSITNEDGTALLTVVRVGDGSGNIAAVYDCYGRSVLYHSSTYASYSLNNAGGYVLFSDLDHVSQLVATGAGTAPDRYAYGYRNYGGGFPMLHTIDVPSPTGASATSRATINYDDSLLTVSSLTDGNGYTTSFASVSASGSGGGSGDPGSPSAPGGTLTVTAGQGTDYTQVTVSGSGTPYSYVGGYAMNMNGALLTDGAGRVTMSKTFDATTADPFRPTSQTDGNGNVTHYVWDQYGNLHQKTSPRGTVTDYTWAFPSGQVPSVVNSVTATNGGFTLGEKVSVQQRTAQGASKTATVYSYYEPSGLVQSVNSPLPGTVGAALPSTATYSYAYNSYGDITSVTTRGNSAASTITTTYGYGSNPVIAQCLMVTDNLGHSTQYRYDAQANKIAEIDSLGNETDRLYYNPNDPTTYGVDSSGTRQSLDGQLRTVLYPATGQTGSGRASDVSTYLYTGGPILTDAKYDESGAVARQVQLAYGNEGESLSQVGDGQPEYVTYDSLYRVATFSDGKGQATSYTYNQDGYPATKTYANGNQVQYISYDADGDLLEQIDGRGVETDYTYADPESKLTASLYPATPAINVHLTYDGYGRKATATDGVGAYLYAYDDLNKETSVVTTYTGLPAQTISYAYYPDGSHQSMTTPAGTFSYTDDAAGRAASLTNPSGETSSWTFLNNNWLAIQNSGNILTATYTHNQRGLIIDLTNRRNSDSALLSEFGNILYDSVGNMDAVTATVPSATAYSGTITYAYNSKNELNTEQGTETGGYTNNFVYDGAGNPTTFKGTTNSFNGVNQNTANSYDAAGNPTAYGGVTLSFDAESRLTACGSVLTNGYRGDSLRAWKQNSGGRTYFLYSGYVPVCELSSSGTVTATNTFGPAGLISRHTSSGSVFYGFDAHGSVVQRLDGGGGILSTQAFDAYGTRQSTDNNNDPYGGFGGQSGYYTDWETGTASSALELLTFRYYDPSAGRFLTRDPVGYKGGANEYEYVNNGPATTADASGLFIWNPVTAIGGATAGCFTAIMQYNSVDQSDPNSNYNNCVSLGGCAASIAGSLLGTAVEGWAGANPALIELAPVLAGCAEGFASSLLKAAVNWACQHMKPCPEDLNKPCVATGVILDTIAGCTAGGILGEATPQTKAGITSFLTGLVLNQIDSLCESSNGASAEEH